MPRHLGGDELDALLDWPGVVRAIADGHRRPPADLDDILLHRGADVVLSRAAMIDGLGSLVKTATVFPGNTELDRPTVNGAVNLFSDRTGELDATIDFHLLTKWKTAADSLLAATYLARPDARTIVIVGAGTVGASMIDAYRSNWPTAEIVVWSRTAAHADELAQRSGVAHTDDLEAAVRAGDIVSTATMATDPLLRGTWLRPGQHIDLIGGYRPDMREADDDVVGRGTVFADSCATAADVGDIAGPLAAGVIDRVVADFGDLDTGAFARSDPDEITVFKNAGGAHLDLMVARHMFERSSDRIAERC